MISTPARLRTFQLALVASAAVGLSACSRNDADTAAASAPATVAAAPVPTPATAPVIVAQADKGYEQGRRDQQRKDAQRAARELPPRADRDIDLAPAPDVDQQRWRHDHQLAAAQCGDCGVVESITAVKVQGQTNGVGALAGGVGGAVVGNQVAGHDKRALGGVLGAVGGGLIGNAIEKHQRSSVVYDVNVRMGDGSLRTLRESTAPAVGEKVRVEADGLHDRS